MGIGFFRGDYLGYSVSSGGLATSSADLLSKINDGTATSNDYIDVAKDLVAIGSAVASLAVAGGVIVASSPIVVGLIIAGVGLAILDYVDEHNYDIDEIMDDLASKTNQLGEILGEVLSEGGVGLVGLGNDLAETLEDLLTQLPDTINPQDLLDRLLDGLQNALPGGLASLFGDLIDGISAEINDLWEFAQNWVRPHDPLVLDLDGDGVETFGITADTQVLFDSNGNGIKTATGWVSSDDGILVLDRNGNGLIDNGSELFGDQTIVDGVKAKDGFEALRAENTNGNGLFDTGDANFANVKVWRDFNSDGISDEGELFSLSELGIASINLSSNATSTSSNGNVTTATGSYMKTDGSTYGVGNLNFISNTFYSEFTDAIELDDTALSLLNVHGSGMIRNLQEASMLSDDLTQTVQDMQEQGYVSKDVFMEQVDALVAQWAQTSTMQSSIEKAEDLQDKTLVYLPSTSSSDMRLYVDMNIHFFSATSGSSGSGSMESFSPEDSARYEALEAQSEHLAKIVTILERFNGENFVAITEESTVASRDTTVRTFTGKVSDGGSGSGGSVYEIPYTFVGLSERQVELLEQSYATLKESVYGSLVLQTRLKIYMDAIMLSFDEGGFGLDMSGAIDMLDTLLQSDLKNAVIDWDDLFRYGSNTFGVLANDLVSSLHDWISVLSEDTLKLEELAALQGLELANGILNVGSDTSDSIILEANSESSVVIGGAGDDSLIVRNAEDNLIIGGSGNDKITANNGDDILYGDAGNDTIHAGNGDNIVDGGSGNDTIMAGSDNDIIIGGTGDDKLDGGKGNDTYIFNRGDGKDIIRDYDITPQNIDTLQFSEGISVDDIIVKISGNDLIIGLKEEGKSFEELSNTVL